MGPGLVILRVPSDGGQNPADGLAEVLYYEIVQDFVTSATGATVTTDVVASCPSLGATGNTNAQALGTLDTALSTIDWHACEYDEGWDDPDDNQAFTLAVALQGTGDGCMSPYNSEGTVLCNGWACSFGGLPNGEVLVQDDTWPQILMPFVFSNNYQNISMAYTQVPNDKPSFTKIKFSGSLTDITCQ